MSGRMRKIWLCLMIGSFVLALVGCSQAGAVPGGEKKVVIVTNGDEEAVMAMETVLKAAGYEGQYIVQSLGTSELGGKLIAEGDQIEADLVTMSSYFLETAQEEHQMFKDLTFTTQSLDEYPAYHTPFLANTGALFVNTEVLKEKGLSMPKSIRDLTKPEFKGLVSIPNMMDSSTGWLLIQAILAEYGESEGENLLRDLLVNVGPHLESSGSGPLKKVQAGEVAAGFGLRHQAVLAQEQGIPIDYIDPIEGNFSLIESIAVVNKEEEKAELAMEMAEVIVNDSRKELLKDYPVALYKGETISNVHKPAYTKKFEVPLSVELLKQHQEFFQSAK
ncbi:iron(III) transport system substrate-binding protein [Lederbergia galactosidilyticus]|uniref:extracellular solute-binding protein n=1 Tax=Lederbergia galactosidilytica TaxID=217031 RepID=UPI001D354150|nr:extracellular solute-binding protein [Lederbergia galactosidilytica]MBP1915079.1 iron(III) transport system substrate-binding protein [Lederbergia galactosidilytica]